MIIDIAIICPLEVEFQKIRKILKNAISTTAEQSNLAFDFGQIEGEHFIWNVAIIEPAFNNAYFEIKVNKVVQHLKPKYIFLAGVAGGIKDVIIGDIVVGTKAYGYESGKETANGFVSRPDAINNDSKQLLMIARKVAREFKDITIANLQTYFGPIASGKKVIAASKSETFQIIKEHYNDTLAVELESYGFAFIASELKTQYLNIRGISDLIDKKAKSDADGKQELASEKVALFLERLIIKLPFEKTKQNNPIKVRFTKNKYSLFALRKTNIGTLEFKDDFIELTANEKKILIRNLTEVKHVKMMGDFSKSWVKVKYIYKNNETEIYFSGSAILGLGLWFGGSKQLLNYFDEHKKRQVMFLI